MEHNLWNKRKNDHFDLYKVLFAIATNIPVLLVTGFVIQGHLMKNKKGNCDFYLIILAFF